MQQQDLSGQTLGHYRLKRPVGYGGMATVYLAEDMNLRRDVAVKIFQPGPGNTYDFFQRFEREAQVLGRLDHPNILQVYDYGEQGKWAYLVTPYIAGGSLRDLLKQRGTLPVVEAVRLMSQILNALQYAHELGLVHRDIKPGNMLLKPDGMILLSDFGLVKIVSSESLHGLDSMKSLTGHMIAGTPDYMAPEQIAAQTVPASDIYAVGVVLYEMLSGKHVFTTDNSEMGILMKHLYEPPRPLRTYNPAIPPQLEAVVMRALEKDPARRYQNPADFALALQAATFANPHPATAQAEAMDTAAPTVETRWQSSSAFSTTPAQSVQSVSSVPPAPGRDSTSDSKTRVERKEPAEPVSNGGLSHSTTPVSQPQLHISAPISPGPGGRQASPVSPHSATTPNGSYAQYGQNVQYTSYSPSTPIPTSPTPQQPGRPHRPIIFALIILIFLALIGVALIPLFASGLFGPRGIVHNPTPTHGHGPTPVVTISGKGKQKGGTPVVTNPGGQPVTTCPATGNAHAAIMPSYTPGNDPNIIYVVNEGTTSAPTFGTVKRHDTVTGKSTEIIKTANTEVLEAQVSADGRWVLYNAIIGGQDELRLIRVDGQDAQTLTCAPGGQTITDSQWSLNEQYVVFNEGGQTGAPTMYLLNMTTGALQKELIPASTLGYQPRTWLDDTHVVLTGFTPNSDNTQQGLYLLNISHGPNQSSADLSQIASSTPCWSFDTGFDGTKFFTAQCGGSLVQPSGPSSITMQSVTGGSPTTVYSDPNMAITQVRAISATKLLFLVENYTPGPTNQNGLWSVNTDGSRLTRLSTDTDGSQSLCPFSQYYWSNVSRDGSMYALQGYNPGTNEYKMLFGPLNGGTPTTFADISDGTTLRLAGWTTV